MSADFISFVAWPKPAVARRCIKKLLVEKSVLEDVVDSSGSSVFDPRCIEPYRPKRLAGLVGRQPAPPEDFSTAYVDVRDPTWMDALKASKTTMSPNFPAIVVIDRAFAIPSGISLMRGRPFARIRPKALARLHEAWAPTIARFGGPKLIARRLAPYFNRWGNGYRDAAAALFALSRGIRTATELDRDLLLVGMTIP